MNQQELAYAIKRGTAEALSQSGLLSGVNRKAIFKGATGKVYDPDDAQGFKSFGELLHTIKLNPQDVRLKQLSEGSDPSGGFLVPEAMANTILMDVLENAVVRPLATKIPMATDTMNLPRIYDIDHSGEEVYGGLKCYWTQEAGTKTLKEPVFSNVKLIAKKLTGLTYASDELLEDSAIALEALLVAMFSKAIAWYEDQAFINGSGVGEPLGFMNSGSLISVTRTPATATVVTADLAGMQARLLPGSHKRAVWVCNPDVIQQLMQLATTSLTFLSLDGGLTKDIPNRLLGRPILYSEHMQALGTTGDIALCDFSYYLIGDRTKGIKVDVSTDYRFVTDETTWRFVKRVDGQPWVDSEFTPKHGATLSPFVVLTTATT